MRITIKIGTILRNRNIAIATFFFAFVAVVIALVVGGAIAVFGSYALIIVIGTLLLLPIIIFRQDELAIIVVFAIQLFVDWFLGLHIVSQLVAVILLLVFYLTRSLRHPWIEPRALWLWALFLVLTIYPAIHGALTLYDAGFYYPNIVFGALTMFWLGTIISRGEANIERLFKMLAVFAALIAIHTIIQETTGKFLFTTNRFDIYLAQASNFQFTGTDVARAGSFFEDPNWNGTFFAMTIFISLGLFFRSSSWLGKFLYLAEISLMLPALLFTYSNGAWIGTFAGMVVFIVFSGRSRYRFLIPLFIFVAASVLIIEYPLQVSLQLQHASNPYELSIRVGAWQTAIRVINAFPLTGVGLGLQAYILRAEPYRVSAQLVPLVQPHDSYLELGAMAGLPVLIIFSVLLLFALRLGLRNWRMANTETRTLLGGGIAAVVALSINSVSINGWTLPPLAALGWLILGVISSPLLKKKLSTRHVESKKPNASEESI